MLEPGGAAIGYSLRANSSPYRDSQTPRSADWLYLYEGEHAYIHSSRAGLKFDTGAWRFDAFVTERIEGYTVDRLPSSAPGTTPREPGFDVGLAARLKTAWGTPYVEAMYDASHRSRGSEVRAGIWGNALTSGKLELRPHASLSYRDAKLNAYYYDAGAGTDVELGLYGRYFLAGNWSLYGSLTGTRHSNAIGASPLVDSRYETAATVGVMYDFSQSMKRLAEDRQPVIVRALWGQSSDCDVRKIMILQCTTTHTIDDTDIWGVDVGRTLVKRVSDWPLDIQGFVGVIRHLERGNQADFWQYHAYFKASWYGLPWDRYVRTRLGFGTGLSYVEQIPTMEARDQAKGGNGTWKLLNYLDPTIDFSVGDLVRSKALKETYAGLGVSHRSGMFGWSRQLGWVDGGSNYIYMFVETSF
jgi:outer membrane protein